MQLRAAETADECGVYVVSDGEDEMNPKRLRLIKTVRGDWPIGHKTVAEARIYNPHEIQINPLGAVSVLTPNGWLGIKPEEMEWADA